MTTLTTPEALAVLDTLAADLNYSDPHDRQDSLREARAHLAARVAELATELDRCAELLAATQQNEDAALAELAAVQTDAAKFRQLEELLVEGRSVTHGIATGCRCMSCYAYRILDADEKVTGEGETLSAAIDAARGDGV